MYIRSIATPHHSKSKSTFNLNPSSFNRPPHPPPNRLTSRMYTSATIHHQSLVIRGDASRLEIRLSVANKATEDSPVGGHKPFDTTRLRNCRKRLNHVHEDFKGVNQIAMIRVSLHQTNILNSHLNGLVMGRIFNTRVLEDSIHRICDVFAA
ncbi:unnamed protein product [Somion occarium]|uniref:Uncharacterized protein n=1 Tax=Somion occarium TaxID=3059160 RepID=A0ABP1D2Q1_9APHY